MRRIFQRLHLWLGLVSGLFVFIIALTGSLYAFQEEISSMASYCHVEKSHKEVLSASKIKTIAESQLPGKKMNSIEFQGYDRAVEVLFYGYQPAYYYKVFINPYTGDVLKVKNMNKDFFRIVIQGHYYLWLPPAIGQPLVIGATILFFLVLVTGIVIWFPKNISKIRNRLVLHWKKGIKMLRVNYDLHVIGGIYFALFGILFAFTGLIFGLPPFANGVHKLAGGTKSMNYGVTISKTASKKRYTDSEAMDLAWNKALILYPKAGSISMNLPLDSLSVLTISATQADGKYWKTDYRYYNPGNLQEIPSSSIYGRFSNADPADKLLRMNYDIHTGGIWGITGKIIACLSSLFIASLPITGFVIWWKKRRKRKPILAVHKK